MGAQVIGRRQLLGAGALAAALPALPAWARDPGPVGEVVDLPVGTRATKLHLWRPVRPRGVALLSTGHGSWPERYGRLVDALTSQGFAVVAPVHVDSVRHPDRADFTMQQGFGERLADLDAAVAFAAKALPGLPLIAVGHSFGTLASLCLGGGLAYAGAFRNPAVRAVLGFSTPGRIPGLVQPTAYASVAVPVMIVTGTADTVPGFVTNPADHLLPADTVPTDAYLLVVQGAGHQLVDEDAFARAARPAGLFLTGYGLGDGEARDALAGWKPTGEDRFTVRKGRA